MLRRRSLAALKPCPEGGMLSHHCEPPAAELNRIEARKFLNNSKLQVVVSVNGKAPAPAPPQPLITRGVKVSLCRVSGVRFPPILTAGISASSMLLNVHQRLYGLFGEGELRTTTSIFAKDYDL